MAKVNALQWSISGLPADSGLFTMHVRNAGSTALSPSDAGTAHTAFRALINAMAGSIPTGVTWSPLAVGKAYDVTTAAITDVVTATGLPAPVTGTSAGSYAAGCGLRLNRQTNTIRGRRFVRGAWFLVPLANSAFTGLGEVNSGTRSTFATAQAAFATSMASAGLVTVVYGRPIPKGAANGVMADITGEAPGVRNGLLHKRA
jgi:hypothetical protein